MSQPTDSSSNANNPTPAQHGPRKLRVLWLQTQPEHYFNCMMDDLAKNSDLEYVAAFSYRGPGNYKDKPLPETVRSIILKPRAGHEGHQPSFFGRYHQDWQAELYPLGYQAVIISGYASRTARELLFDCRRRGIPAAIWSDSNLRTQRGRSFRKRIKRRLKRLWLRHIVRAADYLLSANSRGLAYWRYFGGKQKQRLICPCYADYGAVEMGRAADRAEVLKAAGLNAGDRYIYMAANLLEIKGVDLALRAFVAGGFSRQGWHFLVAGVGPLKPVLEQIAGGELGRSIHLLGFQQPGKNLAFMAHADLLVLASRYEAHGIVIAEAMAAGTPVLASDVCGAGADLIKKGISGATFRTGEESDLVAKLGLLLADRAALAAMRIGARTTFLEWFERYSPIRIVDELSHAMIATSGRK